MLKFAPLHRCWTLAGRRPIVRPLRNASRAAESLSQKWDLCERLGADAVLKAIFTWWNGATLGQRFHISRRGVFVGQDDYGNRYFEARDNRDSYDQHKRRWVIYDGYAEASKVPAEWSGWLHYTFDEPPTTAPLKRRAWEKDHIPNLTGTIHAWRPKGSLTRGGQRAVATSDYKPWSPE